MRRLDTLGCIVTQEAEIGAAASRRKIYRASSPEQRSSSGVVGSRYRAVARAWETKPVGVIRKRLRILAATCVVRGYLAFEFLPPVFLDVESM